MNSEMEKKKKRKEKKKLNRRSRKNSQAFKCKAMFSVVTTAPKSSEHYQSVL